MLTRYFLTKPFVFYSSFFFGIDFKDMDIAWLDFSAYFLFYSVDFNID